MKWLLPAEIVKPFRRRFVLVPHVVMGLSMGFAPYVDERSFAAPVFEAIFHWAPVRIWAALFTLAALAGIEALVTGSWRSYRLANVIMLALSSAWLAALIDGRFRQGYVVSLPAFGLWGFIVASCVVVAAFPTVTVVTRERRRHARRDR